MQSAYSEEVIVFLIVANLIVAGFAIFFFLIIRIQQKRRHLYQQQLLEKEYKTREESFLQISRDLHDEIGSSLSGINMFSQLAQQQLGHNNTESAVGLLKKINMYTSEVIEKVSDMAWLLKPNEESLSILLNKVKAYSLAAADSKQIELKFDDSVQPDGRTLSILQRKAIYLISKEAINNAVKYASCKTIIYKIGIVSNRMNLTITDDGKGFTADENSPGNGLKNMRARATEINAILTINSLPGKGTTIELVF